MYVPGSNWCVLSCMHVRVGVMYMRLCEYLHVGGYVQVWIELKDCPEHPQIRLGAVVRRHSCTEGFAHI